MINITDRELLSVMPYLNGLTADVNGGGGKLPRGNFVSINACSPSADFIMPFEKIMFQVAFDTIFLNHYLCGCTSVLETLKTCVQFLNTGGRLVILENGNSESEKRSLSPQEMEGVLGLFAEQFAIETQAGAEPGKSFYMVYRRLADKPKAVEDVK